jgi:hypothetical protein
MAALIQPAMLAAMYNGPRLELCDMCHKRILEIFQVSPHSHALSLMLLHGDRYSGAYLCLGFHRSETGPSRHIAAPASARFWHWS